LEAEVGGVRVRIEAPERCSRFLGIIIRGVQIGPSPAWLAARLWAVGGRPINNIVDATNYAMHELNHPLHAYDLKTLAGPEIRVRTASNEERLRTLDGEERELSEVSSVIADRDRVIGLAGVMGGADTEVGLETTDVFLECAIFDPLHTRRTARQAGLATDASYRFERGVDHTDVEEAIARCARLIMAIGGGAADEQAIRAGQLPKERPVLRLRPSRVEQVLGKRFEIAELAEILEPLGFAPAEPEEDALPVAVPGWRNDVTRQIDLVEEVARRYGYNRFTGEPRALRPSTVPDDPAWERAESVRRLLVARGLLEARSASFATSQRAGPGAVPLQNPLSAEEAFLRTDMISTLLERLETNLARGRGGVRLFEIGSVFEKPNDPDPPALPREELRAAFVFTGPRSPLHWTGDAGDADVWDLKGLSEDLGEALLGATVESVAGDGDRMVGDDRRLLGLDSAGRWLSSEVFELRQGEEVVGLVGRVPAGSVDAPRWGAPIWAGEFRLASVRLDAETVFVPLSPYPAVHRDLALVVARERTAAELEGIIRRAAPPFLQSLRLFDVYEGDEISVGARSLAWRFLFRASDRTLTDDEVEAAMNAITSSLEETTDARIRQS
jgi:phenylalanyl-tRNA synthetase beta chain